MKYMGILEKLLLIVKMIESSLVYIIFIGIIFLTLFLLLRKQISKKVCFIIDLLSTMILTGYTIINNYEYLSKTFDNIMNNIFTNIYFPSIYTYLFVLIFVNIIGITSLLKVTFNKTYKTINAICVLIINFILVLILEIIAKNEIDLFTKSSLFSNTSLVMLLELSVNVFIVWLISIIIIYLANIIAERKIIIATNKELTKKPAITNQLELTIVDDKEEYLNNDNKFIPKELLQEKTPVLSNQYKFIPPTPKKNDNSFDLSSFIPKTNELAPLTNDISINNILNNEVPLVKEEPKPLFIEERDTYTLNDYKIFNKMLKDIKEHNEGSVISIDKNLEYRLITKYSTEKYDMFKKMLKIYSN